MKQVEVRLYGALNDFVSPARRGAPFLHRFTGSPSVKDLLESLGVPHPELDLLLLDGQPVGFAARVEDGGRLAAYPAFESLEVPDAERVGTPLPECPRFVLDVGLGRLAGLLRMLGLDALWRNDAPDDALARTSAAEGRILLTRDLGLLKRSEVVLGYFPRATDPSHQLVEVARRYRLARRMQPFTRCLACNTPLTPATPLEVQGRVPPRVAASYPRFNACAGCGRVYWEGSHHARMQQVVQRLRELAP
ncbi:twitching motility protein PilT [Aggregicoccus sp. 17bor-14]|uniref:Mut7-C RNAse domain-containing protein n=1 Tax=Myxococcaceae TaxID=31 RepID=UPI0012EFE081|nr:Mut7-C ubiquitin/RNAse domain-containing protein [Simulacricoccus sp. 17bor-14]MRI91529.1 twitching motility protein PilT [Aggregicoccus sp. 17bor-14]